eukprot:6474364-Amphidinium_carterae.1
MGGGLHGLRCCCCGRRSPWKDGTTSRVTAAWQMKACTWIAPRSSSMNIVLRSDMCLQQTQTNKSAYIERLLAMLHEEEEEIREIESEIVALRQKTHNLRMAQMSKQEEVKAAEKAVETLEQEVQALQKAMIELEDQVRETERQLEVKERELAKKEQEIEAQEKLIAEKDREIE